MSLMTLGRKINLSLYYYIKDYLLQDFMESQTLIPLYLMDDLSSISQTTFVYESLTPMLPSPIERGRGWVYFDSDVGDCLCASITCSGTPEQSNRIVVYNSTTISGTTSLTVIPDSEYIVDYIDGRVVTSGTCQPNYIDYFWNYISIVDEWEMLESASPPVIVVDISEITSHGYQLGGGDKIIRKGNLHLFCCSAAERTDLLEILNKGMYLKSFPVYNFPKGSVLDFDGTFNGRKNNMNKLTNLFDRTVTSEVNGNALFENVKGVHVKLPLLLTKSRNVNLLSKLNTYRATISFDIITYSN